MNRARERQRAMTAARIQYLQTAINDTVAAAPSPAAPGDYVIVYDAMDSEGVKAWICQQHLAHLGDQVPAIAPLIPVDDALDAAERMVKLTALLSGGPDSDVRRGEINGVDSVVIPLVQLLAVLS